MEQLESCLPCLIPAITHKKLDVVEATGQHTLAMQSRPAVLLLHCKPNSSAVSKPEEFPHALLRDQKQWARAESPFARGFPGSPVGRLYRRKKQLLLISVVQVDAQQRLATFCPPWLPRHLHRLQT